MQAIEASVKMTNGEMKAPERLSVIMPNYNDSATIAIALEAVCKQSRAADEIIVVDDGSTDNSIEIIEECARRYSNVRLVRKEKNGGVLSAVNCGIQVANGDVLCFSSANDSVCSGFFERGMKMLAQYPSAGFFCADMNIRIIDGANVQESPLSNILPRSGHFSPREFASALRGKFICTPTVLIRRHTFDSELYPEVFRWHSDWWSFTLIALKYGICYEPTIYVSFNSDGTNYSLNMRDYKAQQAVFLAVLRAAFENLDLLPLMIKGKIFNLFIYGKDVVSPGTLGRFLVQQRFSPKSIYVAFHLISEKLQFYVREANKIENPRLLYSLNRAYYFCKGRLIDLGSAFYAMYFNAYHYFVKARSKFKRHVD